MSDKSECVKVVVRVRPISSTEISDKRKVIVTADHSRAEISVVNPEGGPPKLFTFDAAYSAESKQEQIYDSTAYPIIESVLKGFNGTIFAVRKERFMLPSPNHHQLTLTAFHVCAVRSNGRR